MRIRSHEIGGLIDGLKAELCSRHVQHPDNWRDFLVRSEAEFVMSTFLQGRVWLLAQDPDGSRMIQGAFINPIPESRRLLQELKLHVLEAIACPHANFVIEVAITEFTFEDVEFIVDELSGLGLALAVHRYGCRIMLRLLDYFAGYGKVQALVGEMLPEVAEVCKNQFGRHVVGAVLEYYGPDSPQRACVVRALEGRIVELAMNRHASYVVEALLEADRGEQEDGMNSPAFREHAVEILGENLDDAHGLANHRFGRWVLNALVRKSRQLRARGLRGHEEWTEEQDRLPASHDAWTKELEELPAKLDR